MAYTQQALIDGEKIWAASLPPDLIDDEIAIAYFGESVLAKMKQVYRQGLSLRYGKTMQATAGVHYNYSVTEHFLASMDYFGYKGTARDRRSSCYFHMIKRFHQLAWLLVYLFGCSPICTVPYAGDPPDYIQRLDDNNYFGPYATSLRMSQLGYRSKVQEKLFISYQDLQSYAHDLLKATETEYPLYNSFGITDHNGQYQQLNGNILQIENEYYNIIRPKQNPRAL